MIGNVGDRVAHGGPIVAVLGAVDNVIMFFIAVLVGDLCYCVSRQLFKERCCGWSNAVDADVEAAEGLGASTTPRLVQRLIQRRLLLIPISENKLKSTN